MNIADFQALNDWAKLVIVEIEVGRKLQEETWIQCGIPNTNAWYIALPDDGEIHKVEIGGAALVEKFTIALCHATASTFYYDDLTKILYVHTSGSDNPGEYTSGVGYTYNINAFWWEYFSNRPKQLQSHCYKTVGDSDVYGVPMYGTFFYGSGVEYVERIVGEAYEDILKESNGGFEFWISATVPEGWTPVIAGTSTVTKETTVVYDSKSYASCKLTGDAGNNDCYVYRTESLKPRRRVKFRLNHIESAAGKNIYVLIRDSASNVYLNTSGEWVADYQYHAISNSITWAEWEFEFITHPDYSQYLIAIINLDLTSAWACIDNVELLRYRQPLDCHVFLPQGAIPSVCQGVGDYYQPDEKIQFGITKINNVDGWFWSRRYEDGYLWHGRDIRLKVGRVDEAYEDLAIFFTGVTRKPVWGNVVEIGVKDERVLLNKIPCEYFDEETYPIVENEWKGKRIPYLLGPTEDIKPPQIDIENQIFKVSQAVFDRKVSCAYYLNDGCGDLAGWTEDNTGVGDVSQATYDGKSTFYFAIPTDDPENNVRARIYRDAGSFPVSYIFEVRWFHRSNLDTVAANKHVEFEIWNGVIKLHIRIDINSIDIWDGLAFNSTAVTTAEGVWYTYKFDVDGSVLNSEVVDVYRNGTLIVNNADCSNADTATNGKVQITVYGDEGAYRRGYADYIRVYTETVISAGTTIGIEDITHVYKTTGAGVKTELTLGADWAKDLNNGEFTVSAALAEGDVITCDAFGLKCDFEDSTFTHLPADFLYFLYVTLNGISKYRLDMASLHDLKTNRVLICGKWISEETDSIDFLIELKKTGIFQTYVRLDGTIVFHRYSDTVPDDAPHYYNEDYVEKPREEEDTDQCFKEVTIKSCYRPYGAYYEYEEVAREDNAEWNHKEKERLTIETILQTQFQARNLRDNILSMVKIPPSVISATLKSSALLLNPTDKIYLNYTEKDSEGNDITIYDEEVVRILSTDKDLNAGHVQITAMKDVADFFWTIT